ncbi:MAG: ABC transporter substrate-binding protein [bacterium]|nr:ABC transporter substrate-binding protein [Candidatus Kapabacteria bacterium]
MLFAVGAGDRVIGRTAYCNYPPAAESIAIVSDLQTPNYERLVSLRPDLVLMTFAGNSVAAYDKLVELGLEPFAIAAESIAGTLAAIDTVGLLVGRRDAALSVSRAIRTTIDSIQSLAKARARVTTFVVLDRAPLMTVSGGFVNEALTIAGGENIAAGDLSAYPRYSREEVLRRDPEVIIVPGDSSISPASLVESFPEWSRLRAVRNGRVYTIPPDVLFRPGPRLAQSIRLLYETLHPTDALAK